MEAKGATELRRQSRSQIEFGNEGTATIALSPLLRGLRRLLTFWTNAGKLKRMAHAGIPALLGDLILKTLDHALVDRLDLMAGAADQVMMVMMPVARLDFMPRRTVDPGDPLDEFLFLENRD